MAYRRGYFPPPPGEMENYLLTDLLNHFEVKAFVLVGISTLVL